MLDYPDWYIAMHRKIAGTRLGTALFQTYHSPTMWQNFKYAVALTFLGNHLKGKTINKEKAALTAASLLALYYSNIVHSAKVEHAAQLVEEYMAQQASAAASTQNQSGQYL